jgi:FlaA1/EpsC-like NDP-sugar epimerase
MTRYFMTIPEAVHLIIQSGSLPRRGRAAAAGRVRVGADAEALEAIVGPPCAEVYVLDMGEPIRIVDLARAVIELSGLDPDTDIDIEIVGRRGGEKLREKLFNDYESPLPTAAEKILLAERAPLEVDAVEAMFAEIGLLVLEGDAAGLAAKVSALSATRAPAGAAARASSMGLAPDREPRTSVPPTTPEPVLHSRDS